MSYFSLVSRKLLSRVQFGSFKNVALLMIGSHLSSHWKVASVAAGGAAGCAAAASLRYLNDRCLARVAGAACILASADLCFF